MTKKTVKIRAEYDFSDDKTKPGAIEVTADLQDDSPTAMVSALLKGFEAILQHEVLKLENKIKQQDG